MKKLSSLTLCILLASLLFITPVLSCTPPFPPKIIYIRIGDIAQTTSDLPNVKAIAKIALDDINSYLVKEKMPYRIQVEYKDAKGSDATHLKMVQELKWEGVNLLLAGRWSSQAQTSLSYINTHNMLMLSPSSTSPALAIANDNLFRLCPSDSYIGPALAHTVYSKGVEHVVIIQRGDSWGDGLYDEFTKEYTALGLSMTVDRIRYDTNAITFSSYLDSAEALAANDISHYGSSKVGVVLLAFNEAATILNEASSSYANLYGCTWFGTDGTANNQVIITNAGTAAAHVGLYSLMALEIHGPKWSSVESRYQAATGQLFSSYTAYEYDIFWIYALSVIKADSTNPASVKAVLPSVAARYNGASGFCKLNMYGDRLNAGFDIWGYAEVGGQVQSSVYGSVDTNNNVSWKP